MSENDEPLIDPSPARAPMSARQAEAFFRYLVASDRLRLDFAAHARKRFAGRALSAIDVRALLAGGEVMATPRMVDALGRSKYTLQGVLEDEDGAKAPARIVVLAAPRSPLVRVITAMWVEEKLT